MSDKYLIRRPVAQEPNYDPKFIAEGLGSLLLGFLGPLLLELDRSLDKRLIRTLVRAVEAILTFRDQIHGLLLTELGAYLDPLGQGGGGTKRLSRLVHSEKWKAVLIEHFLLRRCDQQIESWHEHGPEGLVLWDGSVWEKPESLASDGLCAVLSSKAKRLTHVKPGYFNPPGKPVCVPGLHWIGLVLVGRLLTQGPAMVACMRWWTSRGAWASWLRDEELKLLRHAMHRWGSQVMHVFDRGYASSVWLGALRGFATRFTLRWKHQYHLRDAHGLEKAAWKIAASVNGPGRAAPCATRCAAPASPPVCWPSPSVTQTIASGHCGWWWLVARMANPGICSPVSRWKALSRPGPSSLPTCGVGRLNWCLNTAKAN